ncbi:MAG: SpoIIIAH-like family protein [Clostridia bacterium]|nr:SpoIIIAH-like family protein [Clostridia bacterium]
MKRFFGKKQVLLATLAVALGLAVYLNYYFAQQELPAKPSGGTPSTGTTSKVTGGNLGDSQYVSGSTTIPGGGATPTNPNETPYFKQARESREAARAESLEMLQELANDVKSSQAVIDDATQKILAVAQAVEQESKIESLVKAKGFADCVAYIEGENCNVVVLSEGLTAAQTLQITEIVTAQSTVKSENIKISAINS